MNDSEVSQLVRSVSGADREETHISYILLTESYAYKIKKNVRLPFLDFSSLEKRKHYCEEELRLNRRLAPEMYLDVVPIRRQEDDWQLEGSEGQLVDYAVKMQRMDVQRIMHRQLDNRRVSSEQIIKLAEKVAAFHAEAPVIIRPVKVQQQAATFNEIQEHTGWIASHLGKEYATTVERAVALSDTFLSQHTPLLNQRSEAGLVREVHGDLHTHNIFLYDEPIIFDCIEFNAAFRQLDLLNEVAFLCMDLEAHDTLEYSRLFYERYLQQMHRHGLDEVDHEALFTYFKLYRANVRVKVMVIDAQENQASDPSLHDAIVRYVQQMQVHTNHLLALTNVYE